MSDDLSDFERFDFSYGGGTKTVYRRGFGPPVLIMHEVPGITAEVARFARIVIKAGFTVFLPRLFGRVGHPTLPPERVGQLARLCVSREFHLLAENRASPIVDWLRALAARIAADMGGRGVGVLGMCVTGNFGLTMALDPWVVAPVLAHPSLPLPITPAKSAALHASPRAMDNLRLRRDAEDYRVLGVRFEEDILFCRAARFATLRRELGDGFEGIELPPGSSAPNAEPPHSATTIGLIDRDGEPTRAAVDRILAFFHERLR